jgi:FkbM family methyltransferase
MTSVIASLISKMNLLASDKFFLLDIGCSGGINPIFRSLGENNLYALGFDPMTMEIDRLSKEEQFHNIFYVNSFVGLPESTDYWKERSQNPWGNNPWERLSVYSALQTLANSKLSNKDKNDWKAEKLSVSSERKTLDDIVSESGSIPNFIKIDVDGADLEVLYSSTTTLADPRLLGIQIEVNYFGTEDVHDNTFHNIDRLLRSFGFELFDLSTRRYSNAALPSKFLLGVPAQSLTGRILQGDAIYFRDIARTPDVLQTVSLDLLKLSALFEFYNMPDCACEILTKFREQIDTILDVDSALDLITRSHYRGEVSYRNYLDEFSKNPLSRKFVV